MEESPPEFEVRVASNCVLLPLNGPLKFIPDSEVLAWSLAVSYNRPYGNQHLVHYSNDPDIHADIIIL